VFVSGPLRDHGAPARVVDLFISSDLAIVVDDRILSEYREVLYRPALQLEDSDVTAFLDLVEGAEHVVGVPLPVDLPDPDDEPFLEVAIAGGVDAIVIGNARHFRVPGRRRAIPMLSPSEFLRRMAGRQGRTWIGTSARARLGRGHRFVMRHRLRAAAGWLRKRVLDAGHVHRRRYDPPARTVGSAATPRRSRQ
jgi:predicted nucleic acid-binding protein